MANKEWVEIGNTDELLNSMGFTGRIHASTGKNFVRWGRKKAQWATLKESIGKKGVYRWLITGDWRSGTKEYFCQPPDGHGLPSKKEQSKIQKEMDTSIRQHQQEAHISARTHAQKRLASWSAPEKATPYMAKKMIGDILNIDLGLRAINNETLVIPNIDQNGVVWGYQRIFKDGRKYFLEGQRIKHTYHWIPGDEKLGVVYICEGFSTGASIRLATGAPVMVLFSTSNMKASVNTIRHRLKDTRIIVCADNDAFTDGNPGITAGKDVAEELNTICIWPIFPDSLEQNPTDFNDFHTINGLDALADFIEEQVQAHDNTITEDTELYGYRVEHKTVNTDKLTTKDIATLLLRDHAICYDSYGGIYRYETPIWRPIVIDELKRLASEYDNIEHDTDRRRTETAKEVMNATFRRIIPFNNLKKNEIVCKNGIYNLSTEEIREHKASDFIDKYPPHNYVANNKARMPRFLKYLTEVFENDPPHEATTKRLQLQMFMGYCLMSHANYKKALVCIGDTNTGKSVFAQVLQMLVGHDNVCGIDISDMDNSRKLQPIQGKMLNIINEPPSNALFADGGFKRLVSSGEELIQIDPKYKSPFMYHPTAKHAIITNHLPGINDSSDATYRRLMVVKFDRQFSSDEQDPDLIHKLKDEMEGIFNWAIEGAYLLYMENGQFPQTNSEIQFLADHKEQGNEPYQYLLDHTEHGQGYLPLKKLLNSFRNNTTNRKMQLVTFSKAISNMGVKVEKALVDGKKQPAIPNLRLVD